MGEQTARSSARWSARDGPASCDSVKCLSTQVERLNLILGRLVWQIDQSEVLVILNDVGIRSGGESGTGTDLLCDGITQDVLRLPPDIEEKAVSCVTRGGNVDRARCGPTLSGDRERSENRP